MTFRVGSLTAEDIISFTVSNYDAADGAEVNQESPWNGRLVGIVEVMEKMEEREEEVFE